MFAIAPSDREMSVTIKYQDLSCTNHIASWEKTVTIHDILGAVLWKSVNSCKTLWLHLEKLPPVAQGSGLHDWLRISGVPAGQGWCCHVHSHVLGTQHGPGNWEMPRKSASSEWTVCDQGGPAFPFTAAIRAWKYSTYCIINIHISWYTPVCCLVELIFFKNFFEYKIHTVKYLDMQQNSSVKFCTQYAMSAALRSR